MPGMCDSHTSPPPFSQGLTTTYRMTTPAFVHQKLMYMVRACREGGGHIGHNTNTTYAPQAVIPQVHTPCWQKYTRPTTILRPRQVLQHPRHTYHKTACQPSTVPPPLRSPQHRPKLKTMLVERHNITNPPLPDWSKVTYEVVVLTGSALVLIVLVPGTGSPSRPATLPGCQCKKRLLAAIAERLA